MSDGHIPHDTITRIIGGTRNLFHFFPVNCLPKHCHARQSSSSNPLPFIIPNSLSVVIPAGRRRGQVVILSRRRRIYAPSETTQGQRKPLPISYPLRQSARLHLPSLPASPQVVGGPPAFFFLCTFHVPPYSHKSLRHRLPKTRSRGTVTHEIGSCRRTP